MKKLLLILLCVPLLYSCQQNNPNPNNPAGTFLENNDGAVYNHISGLGGGMQYGFYNSTNFIVLKGDETSCFGCGSYFDGAQVDDGGVVTNVLNNTDFSYEIVFPNANGTGSFTGLYEFIQDGNNQIIIHMSLDGVLAGTGVFTKSSTETNLACN